MQRKVLIVDDSEELANTLKLALEQSGDYKVRVETDPTRAKQAALDLIPDIILMDVIMPGMDGGMVVAEIREDERMKSTPVIFLTSILDKGEANQHGGRIGHDPVLAKPVTMSELTRRMKDLLDH